MRQGIPSIEDEKVREALETLPDKNKSVLYMRFWGELRIEEIAKVKKMTWGEANRLIDESLLQFKKVLVNEYMGGKYEE